MTRKNVVKDEPLEYPPDWILALIHLTRFSVVARPTLQRIKLPVAVSPSIQVASYLL